MKGLAVFLGIAAAGAGGWGFYEYMKRKDAEKKFLDYKRKAEGIIPSEVDGVGLLGAYGVTRV
jgi:hypothetical protein